MRRGGDKALVLESAEQPAHQPRVEAEIVAQFRNIGPPVADRIEHAGRPKRPPASEERGIERTDLRGDGAVEAADAQDGVEHNI
jgi:hypothetical protein